MKNIILSVFIVVCLGLVLTGCNQADSPKGVATTWLNAFYHMDYESAKKVSTDNTKSLLTLFAQMSGSVVPDSVKQQTKSIKVSVKNVVEKGDKAVVSYTLSNQPDKNLELNLVKQNNKWLVQYSKNDGMGSGDNNSNGAEQQPADASQPQDSGTNTTDTAGGGDKK